MDDGNLPVTREGKREREGDGINIKCKRNGQKLK